jgi:hypothetical protein
MMSLWAVEMKSRVGTGVSFLPDPCPIPPDTRHIHQHLIYAAAFVKVFVLPLHAQCQPRESSLAEIYSFVYAPRNGSEFRSGSRREQINSTILVNSQVTVPAMPTTNKQQIVTHSVSQQGRAALVN